MHRLYKAGVFSLILLGTGAFAQQPYYSADGDMLYSDSIARIRALDKPLIESGRALLGSSGPDLITSTVWGHEIRLTYLNDSDTMGLSSGPWATVSDDTIFVAFGISLPLWQSAPFLMSSLDGGENWSEPWCITNDDTAQLASHSFINYHNHRLTVGGRMFSSEEYNYFNVYVKYSEDLGLYWSEPFFFFDRGQRYITRHSGTSYEDTLLFAFYHGEDYHGNDIHFLRATYSLDNGETWSALRNVFEHSYIFSNYCFWMRYGLGRIHLLYQERSPTEGLTEIFYAHSDDWGRSWTAPIVVSDDSCQHSQWPYLYASSEGILMASWYDYKYGSGGSGFAGDILYRMSTDNGENWGEEMQLTDHHEATASRSFMNGDHIGMLWEDTRSGFFTPEFYFAESFDMGQTWTEELRLTDAPGMTTNPQLCYENSGLYLFWEDARDNPPFGVDVYFRPAEIEETEIENIYTIKPRSVGLSCYPNPFNSRSILTLNGYEGGDAAIEIYDITGVKVRTLKAEEGKASWDATDNSGRKVSSGIYFARVETPQKSRAIKLVYLK